jgi:hypothetical protein
MVDLGCFFEKKGHGPLGINGEVSLLLICLISIPPLCSLYN